MSGRCRRLLAEAARVAAERRPDVVLLTGGRGGEADQMRAAWPGRTDVDLVVEPTATITAENASRSLPLLLARGVTEATVVCAPLHLPRVRYLFGSVYGRAGIHTRFRTARAVPTPSALAWELGAALVARRQRRAAEAEFDA